METGLSWVNQKPASYFNTIFLMFMCLLFFRYKIQQINTDFLDYKNTLFSYFNISGNEKESCF